MFSKLIGKLLNKPEKRYCINPDYIINKKAKYCDKRREEPDKEAQKEVYEKALEIVKKNNYKSILDIGCGSGWKLRHYFGDYDTLGLEVSKTLRWLKQNYPNDNWEQSDFSSSLKGSYDMIICADVIEHLVDPDELVSFLKRIDFKMMIISTPERDVTQKYQKGITWNGPPVNNKHIREWSYAEFSAYLGQNFEILEQYYDCPTDCERKVKVCQVTLARKYT